MARGRRSKKVRECLEEVAISGTAKDQLGAGKVPCSVGAKTGTAQYAQGAIKYSDHYYVGSMAAYFPADKPRYTIYTSILTNGANYYGHEPRRPREPQGGDVHIQPRA